MTHPLLRLAATLAPYEPELADRMVDTVWEITQRYLNTGGYMERADQIKTLQKILKLAENLGPRELQYLVLTLQELAEMRPDPTT